MGRRPSRQTIRAAIGCVRPAPDMTPGTQRRTLAPSGDTPRALRRYALPVAAPADPLSAKENPMTLCPVAIAVGCKKCPIFSVCPVKGVIGDYKKEPEKPASGAAGKGQAGAKRGK